MSTLSKVFRWGWFLPVMVCFLAGFPTTQSHASPKISLWKGQCIYVPVYSHIYSGDREHPFYLTATLSIRNTDLNNPIEILSADYYDSSGKLLKKYLKGSQHLKPLETVRYIVKESDKEGGSGAKFIVTWQSQIEVNEPIIETIMIGTKSQQGISFISQGKVIEKNMGLK